jgi:hypothetical protein
MEYIKPKTSEDLIKDIEAQLAIAREHHERFYDYHSMVHGRHARKEMKALRALIYQYWKTSIREEREERESNK